MKKLVKETLLIENKNSINEDISSKIQIRTIKDLKEVIKDFPDDMGVMGYNGGNGDLFLIGYWVISKETLSDEEIQQGYPEGVTPTFVISVD